MDLLTKEPAPEQHIDILSCRCTLTFKIGSEPKTIDRFVFLSYYFQESTIDYSVKEFKIYFSNNEEDLYDDENLFYTHRNYADREGPAQDRTNKHCDVMLTFQPIKAKYFGMKLDFQNNRKMNIINIIMLF